MEKNRILQHRTLSYSLLLTVVVFLVFSISSCSTSKRYGQTSSHQRTSYRQVRVKQARWNTTTSTATVYYIKKPKQRKKYNP